ncbi:MAG: head-tail connector protein [Bacillota bacterium]
MITTIYDNLDITVEEAKSWLNQEVIELDDSEENPVELPEDDDIERLIDAAKRKADNYIDQDEEYFENDEEEVEIPEDIEQWVLSVVARWYERRANGEAQKNISGGETVQWNGIDFSLLTPYRNLYHGPLVEDDDEDLFEYFWD